VGSAGVSIIRAGREIDFGWYLMGAKRRENYDDWWRCEVRFAPELDELFGVTHSKQGITPSPELRLLLEPDLEAIARTLNARVRAAFETLKVEARAADSSPAARAASANDSFLTPIKPPASRSRSRMLSAVERARNRDGTRYRIEVQPIGSPEFFTVTRVNESIVLTINRDHPFYSRAYQPACEDPSGRERFNLECVLLSAARAQLTASSTSANRWLAEMRQQWGDALAAFLDR
jgi:hypothetical protein